MAEYLINNPQFIVNGFIKAGIAGALDCIDQDEDSISEDFSDGESSDNQSSDNESNDDGEDTIVLDL